MLLSIGDRVLAGTYRFHSQFQHAVNFEQGGRLLCVVDEVVGPGPANIVLRHLPDAASDASPAGACPLPNLEVTRKAVVFANRRFAFSSHQRYDSTLDFEPGRVSGLESSLVSFRALLKKAAPPKSLAFLLERGRLGNFRTAFDRAFAIQIQRGVRHVFHGDLLAGIGALRGCGLGLTPSGDDFIAGVLIGLAVLEKLRGENLQRIANVVFSAAQGDNIFSNTFLDLARRGLVFGRMKDVMQALVSGRKEALREATGKLLAVGASSGADLATGLLLTLDDSERFLARITASASGRQPLGWQSVPDLRRDHRSVCHR